MKTAKEYRDQQIAHIAEMAESAYAQHVVRHEQHTILGEACQVWSAKRPDGRTHWFNVFYHAGPCGSTLLVDGDFGSLLLRGVLPWSLADIAGWDMERIARYASSDMPVREFDPDLAEIVLREAILEAAAEGREYGDKPELTGKRVQAFAEALATFRDYDKEGGTHIGNVLCQSDADFDGETAFSYVRDAKLYTPTFVWGISAIRWLARQTSGKPASTPTFATDGVVTIPSPISMPEAESLSILLPTDLPQAAQESLRLLEEPTPNPEVRDGGEGV